MLNDGRLGTTIKGHPGLSRTAEASKVSGISAGVETVLPQSSPALAALRLDS